MRISDWSSDVCSSDLQLRRQDPRTRNLSGGEGFDNVHQDSFRASLLVEPFDGVRNTTIFDYLEADERPAGIYLYATTPGIVPFADPLLAAYVAGQRAAGPRAAYSDLRGGGYDNRKVWGRSDERRGGKECVSTCRSRWWPYH